MGFYETEMGFWKIVLNILKCAELSETAVECDRHSQSSQDVQNLIFIKKYMWVFPEKTWIFENR